MSTQHLPPIPRGLSDVAWRNGSCAKGLKRDLDLVRSVPPAETAYRELVLSEMLTLAALGRWSGELTPFEHSIRSRPANIDVKPLEACLAELTLRRIGLLPSIDSDRSCRLVSEGLPAETWTDRVISVIQADAAKVRPRSQPLTRDLLADEGLILAHAPAAKTGRQSCRGTT